MSGMKDIFSSERRNFIRIQDNLEVIVTYKESKKKETQAIVARGLNISEKGIEISADESLPQIRSVSLEIQFPNPFLPIITDGKIVWRSEKKNQYGIQFIKTNKELLKIICDYVNRPSFTRKLKILVNRRQK